MKLQIILQNSKDQDTLKFVDKSQFAFPSALVSCIWFGSRYFARRNSKVVLITQILLTKGMTNTRPLKIKRVILSYKANYKECNKSLIMIWLTWSSGKSS